jgi:hypothetical protein
MDDFRAGFIGGFACGLALVVIPGFFLTFVFAGTPWLKCFLTGSRISLLQILGMVLRGTPVRLIADAQIALVHSGISMSPRFLETAYLTHPGRIHTAADLVNLVRWGLFEADPKPPWAVAEFQSPGVTGIKTPT